MKKYLLLIYSFLPLVLFAQIGINTESPTGALSVVSPNNLQPIVKVENSDNKPLLTVNQQGYMGVGLSNPVTKLDLRSAIFADNIIGLGTTSQTAAAAGEGAVRYQAGVLQYSDGIEWLSVAIVGLEKAYVIANHTAPFSLTYTTGTGISGVVTNWNIMEQQGSSFNAGTGVFTAPRTGIYSVSITGVLIIQNASTTTFSGNQIDIQTDNSVFRIAKSYAGSLGVANYTTSVTNKAYVYLNVGEHIFTDVWFNGGNRNGATLTLSANASHNILTIAEM